MTVSNTDNDTVLIDRIKEGNTHAFRQLVYKYKDVSLSLACSVLKDRDVAEDVLQEAFIKVFQKIHSFNQQSAFSTWLYRIVINTAYNELKRHKIHIDLNEIYADESLVTGKTALDLLKEEEQTKYIILALNRLKPDEALVLRLFYLCELSIKEINTTTGFSTSKIKVLLHRGRKDLEQVLKSILGDRVSDLW